MTTIFGKIIKGEIPCEKVYEDEEVVAFKDIHPQAPIHILIVPKKEIAMLQEMEERDFPLLGAMVRAAQEIARKFNIADGYRIVINNGSKGGQSVFHLHCHLLGGTTLKEDCL